MKLKLKKAYNKIKKIYKVINKMINKFENNI